MTDKELFNSYFKKHFKDLHEACCCGDLVAFKYKKAMWKTWQASAKREGFVLVPKEPTEEMVHAGALSVFKDCSVRSIFKVMISAVEVQNNGL